MAHRIDASLKSLFFFPGDGVIRRRLLGDRASASGCLNTTPFWYERTVSMFRRPFSIWGRIRCGWNPNSSRRRLLTVSTSSTCASLMPNHACPN